MIGIGCVFRDTDVYEDVKDAIRFLAEEMIAEGKDANLGPIYNKLRGLGVEIDLQTTGYAYNEIADQTDARFMSMEQINEYVLGNYARALERASKLRTVTRNRELGADKQELAVVNGILNMLFKANTTTRETKSMHLQMQDALWKGIQRKLNIPKQPRPRTMEDWRDVLEKALGFNNLGLLDLQGKLNSIGEMFDAMQEQLEDADRMMGQMASPAAKARWDAAVSALRGLSYSLLLTKSEANQVLMGTLKEAGYTKQITTTDGVRDVKDWTKLAGDMGTVADLRDTLQRVLAAAGYDQATIDAVKMALETEFDDLREAIIRKQIEQEERIAREGTQNTLNDSDLQNYLNGRSPAEWIKVEDIENLEELEQKAEALLASKKYTPAVRQRIKDRLKDFFDRNYAKVITREAREAIRDMLGGLTALEWIMERGLTEETALLNELRSELGMRNVSPKHQQEIMDEFIRILDLRNRAEKNLATREKAIGRSVDVKSDIRRLAELYNLGLFDTGQHVDLLYNLIGVDDLTAQDMADIDRLSKAASRLFKWMQENDMPDQVFATREFQYLQRHIDRLVARNVNNKSKTLKILGALRAFFDLFLSGLLSGPYTIAENMYSGFKVALSAISGGKGKVSKDDLEAYLAMLGDVTRTGQPYGEEIGSFAPRELYSNMLSWKWKGGTPKEKAESLLYLLHMPGRVGLLGFDSANKIFATSQIFKHMIYQALRSHGGMDHASALNFMNTALNGQSFEAAKKQAEEVIKLVNATIPEKFRREATKAAVTTLATDLVRANLNANGVLPTEMVRDAARGAYHVAGYGLGHEPNNWFSSAIAEQRKKWRMREEKLMRNRDWEGLAMHRFLSMFVNSIVIKFAGGATNWIWLRFQEAGLGLVTGGLGKPWRDVDFTDKKNLKDNFQANHLARHKVARALTGISLAMMTYLFYFLLKGDSEEDKKKVEELNAKIEAFKGKRGAEVMRMLREAGVTGITQDNVSEKKYLYLEQLKADLKKAEAKTSIFKRVQGNYMLKRAFLKLAPDAMLIHYYLDTEEEALTGAIKYVQQTTGIASPYSADEKISTAEELVRRGDKEGAMGALGSIVGSSFGVPMWRSTKDWVKTFRWMGGAEVGSDFRPPENFVDGLLGGGMLEDLGVWNPKVKITIVPGIGAVTYQRFKEAGISSLEDLYNTEEWWKLKYTDAEGKEKPILGGAEQAKARKWVEEYFLENPPDEK